MRKRFLQKLTGKRCQGRWEHGQPDRFTQTFRGSSRHTTKRAASQRNTEFPQGLRSRLPASVSIHPAHSEHERRVTMPQGESVTSG